MNEFFGLTRERVVEIQEQIKVIGESLQPYHDAASEHMSKYDIHADVRDLEESELIARGGLLARLDQGLGEAHFWCEGILQWMDAEEIDEQFCANMARVVCEAYGGMRDMQDPYAQSRGDQLISQILGASGLGDMLSGIGVVIRVTEKKPEEAAEPEPVA